MMQRFWSKLVPLTKKTFMSYNFFCLVWCGSTNAFPFYRAAGPLSSSVQAKHIGVVAQVNQSPQSDLMQRESASVDWKKDSLPTRRSYTMKPKPLFPEKRQIFPPHLER